MEKQFEPGYYYIGDPCYPFEESWDELLEKTEYFENEEQNFKGYPIAVDRTAYGDGVYTDNYGREYDVDAGVIGIIPVELISIDERGFSKSQIENHSGMHIVYFDKPFTVETDDEGNFKFGDIEINTKENDEDEDDMDEGDFVEFI